MAQKRITKSYDQEFKSQAVKLAQEIGGHKAATELGIPSGTKSPTTTSSGGLILALLMAMLLLAPKGGVANINTGPLTMRYLLNLLF